MNIREAAFIELLDAARNYAMRYAQDEAHEDGVEHTGCSVQQHKDAQRLMDAVRFAESSRPETPAPDRETP